MATTICTSSRVVLAYPEPALPLVPPAPLAPPRARGFSFIAGSAISERRNLLGSALSLQERWPRSLLLDEEEFYNQQLMSYYSDHYLLITDWIISCLTCSLPGNC